MAIIFSGVVSAATTTQTNNSSTTSLTAKAAGSSSSTSKTIGNIVWNTYGDAKWDIKSNNGVVSAQSGAIHNSESTYITATVYGPGTLYFAWTVSSEAPADAMKYYLDDVWQNKYGNYGSYHYWYGWTGSMSGTVKVTLTGTGTHTFKWIYFKDSSTSSGNDLATLSNVTWTSNDTTAPKISTVSPTNGATNVAASKTITVTFNEVIKKSNKFCVELKNSAGKSISYISSVSGNVLTINPISNLTESLYTLIIHNGAVTDLNGNSAAAKTTKFSVGTSPKVSSSNPTNKATKVVRNKTIKITFNETIKAGSNYNKITLKASNGTTVTIKKSISGKVLTITHNGKLKANTKYTLTLYTSSIKDKAGNPIATKTITFTTGKT